MAFETLRATSSVTLPAARPPTSETYPNSATNWEESIQTHKFRETILMQTNHIENMIKLKYVV